MAKIDILGAGIVGVLQALTLRKRGHKVCLWDPGGVPARGSASFIAGVMLGPFCEGEGHEQVRALGIESLALWRALYPKIINNGTLVFAAPRDQAELRRFADLTDGHRWLDSGGIAEIEPSLGERYSRALFFEQEAHLEPETTLHDLAMQAESLGVCVKRELYASGGSRGDWVIDCRGMGAKGELKSLRGVRGERLILECPSMKLARPVRFLHPRQSIYVVPWRGNRFMLGATVIESEDTGPPTVRSAVELMSAVYALHPMFGEARILDIAANVRPAFPDNLPRIVARGRRIFVNGLYRHGFLLAPILANLTADYIVEGQGREGVVFEDRGEW